MANWYGRNFNSNPLGGGTPLPTTGNQLASVAPTYPIAGSGLIPYTNMVGWTGLTPQELMSIAFPVWFDSLPTSLPATSGQFWNNGGILSMS